MTVQSVIPLTSQHYLYKKVYLLIQMLKTTVKMKEKLLFFPLQEYKTDKMSQDQKNIRTYI